MEEDNQQGYNPLMSVQIEKPMAHLMIPLTPCAKMKTTNDDIFLKCKASKTSKSKGALSPGGFIRSQTRKKSKKSRCSRQGDSGEDFKD